MLRVLLWCTVVLCRSLCAFGADDADNDRGFLERPPVYIGSEPDFPLAVFSADLPKPGVLVPDADVSGVESDGFHKDGENVQPALNVKMRSIRVGLTRGFAGGWAAGAYLPWNRTRVRGSIGGFPAYGVGEGFGDLLILGRKSVWSGGGGKLIASLGLELPTGKDDATFSAANLATLGYYQGSVPRMPLAWQAGGGTMNTYLALAYRSSCGRLSYAGLLAGKINTRGGQNVKIGDSLVGAVGATYGISRNLAFGLGLTLRTQEDDSYPQASPPGVESGLLVGTTTHGTTFYITPSIRVRVLGRLVVGVGAYYPLIEPGNGMVPRVSVYVTAYPSP